VSAMTAGGWCIHGVPYGPGWTCGQCSSVADRYRNTVGAAAPAPAMTAEDVETIKRNLRRIIELLEQIAGVRR
jgi:hypothetical protein